MAFSKIAGVASLMVLATTGFALAGVTCTPGSCLTTSATINPITPQWTRTLSLNGFTAVEEANGIQDATLTKVIVVATENVSGTVNMTNTGSGSETVSANLQDTLTSSGGPASLQDALNDFYGVTNFDVIDPSSSVQMVLAKSASSGNQAVSGSKSQQVTMLSGTYDLTDFTSTWSLSLTDSSGVFVSANPGTGSATYSGLGGTTLEAYYYYSGGDPYTPPVPEPASLMLLGAGLAGLGMVRRRRH